MTTPAPSDASYAGKRGFDIAVLIVTFVPAVVLGILAATAIRLTSKGPVLFRQERVGLHGNRFEVLKFRSMVDADNPVIAESEHITAVGRVLRRLSIDELPQLVNVARGEMSIVGPRPTLGYQLERWTPRQRERLTVRPGLTGWAQVNGRNSLPWSERIELDLVYLTEQSPLTDLRIIARTGITMLSGSGAEMTAADDSIARESEGTR